MGREVTYLQLEEKPDCELLAEVTGEFPHEDGGVVVATSHTSVDGSRHFLSREFPDGRTTWHEVV